MPIMDANTMEFFSRGPDQTRRAGMRLGALIQAGDLICLSGELGAGKNDPGAGIGAGLGFTGCCFQPNFCAG